MGQHAATDVIELPGRRGRLTVVEGPHGQGPRHARPDDEDSRPAGFRAHPTLAWRSVPEPEQRPGRHRRD